MEEPEEEPVAEASTATICRVLNYCAANDNTKLYLTPQPRRFELTIPETAPQVSEVAQIISPYEAFSCLITDDMLEKIITYTNLKLADIRTRYSRERDVQATNVKEIRALLSLLVLAGLLGAAHVNLDNLSSH